MRCFRNIPAVMALFMAVMVPPVPAAGYSIPDDIPALVEAGRTVEAKARLNEFRRTQPGNPLALFYLARIEEDRNLARSLYREVERLDNDALGAEAAFARAEMAVEDGDVRTAEPLLVRVITAHPKGPSYADALYRLGMIRLAAGKQDDALLQFMRSRDAQTDAFKKTLAGAGMLECYVAKKDWNRALDLSREVLDGRDDTGALTPRVLEVVVMAWHYLGNEENAQKFAGRLLNNFPRSYQAYALRQRGGRITADSPSSPVQGASPEAARRDGVRFTIQAGAFVDRVNALKVYTALKNAGFPVRVDMKKIGEKHFYLVRVGEYAAREKAESDAIAVSRLIGASAAVVMME